MPAERCRHCLGPAAQRPVDVQRLVCDRAVLHVDADEVAVPRGRRLDPRQVPSARSGSISSPARSASPIGGVQAAGDRLQHCDVLLDGGLAWAGVVHELAQHVHRRGAPIGSAVRRWRRIRERLAGHVAVGEVAYHRTRYGRQRRAISRSTMRTADHTGRSDAPARRPPAPRRRRWPTHGRANQRDRRRGDRGQRPPGHLGSGGGSPAAGSDSSSARSL